MRQIFLIIIITVSFNSFAQNITTKFEQSGGKESPTYAEIIDWWQKMDKASDYVKMLTMGPTDAGFPLHLVLVSTAKDFDITSIKKNDRRIILINNGIHPGEPDGIDASMLLVRDIIIRKLALPKSIVLAIVPVYNIGGCLNRSKNYRIDQNGPVEKGFRGNSQNLDLNRDFIKCDAIESRSFTEIFHMLDPDVFIDNHVSDGADYQHVMTLLSSQHNKMDPAMGDFLHDHYEPEIYSIMKSKGYDLVPYVNSFGDTPENGWPAFWDSPRYSSGYGTLWQTFSFVPETHMLKSYDQRVKATYELLQAVIGATDDFKESIKELRIQSRERIKNATEFPISWKLDRSKVDSVLYRGYTAAHKPSDVSGLSRLYYDRTKPFEKKVPFYNYYVVDKKIVAPKAYIIPQGWWRVIDLLKINKVQMSQLKRDTTIEVEVYRIDDYKTAPRQYEMHHLNSDLKTSISLQKINFKKGDYYIPMNQEANRFLIETLEPAASDSYFAWNFFDAILGQKEGYSGYSFEDIAADYLNKNTDLKNKLEQRRLTDTAFAKNGRAQLNFVYENSPYFEPASMRYPVYRTIR